MPTRQVVLRREPSQQCQRFSHSVHFDLNIRQEAAAFYWDQGESVCPIAGIKGSKESGVNSEPKLLLPALNRSRKEPALQKTKVGSSNSGQQRYEEEVDLFFEVVISLIHLQYSTWMSDTCLLETWTDTSSSLEINDTPLGNTGVSGEKHTLPRKFTFRKLSTTWLQE